MTCFETFEHFVSPPEEIERILGIGSNVLISTTVRPQRIPDNDWDYYAFEGGQRSTRSRRSGIWPANTG